MNCMNDNKEGVNTCNICGEWLCEDCSVEMEGRIYCNKCAAEKLENTVVKEKDLPTVTKKKTGRSIVNKHPNIILVFMFSMIPGCSHMYMGLMQRGLLLMSMFFGMIYLSEYSNLFFLVGIVLWFYNFFDGFNMRRQILSGENIDELIDMKIFFDKNKKLLLGSIILAAILEILRDFQYNGIGEFINSSLVLVIIAAVLLVIIKMFKTNEKNRRNID